MRRVADLPWQGRVVEIRLHARRFRCADPQCRQRIFTERLPGTVQPKARRTARLGESQLVIGFAVGGEPGSRLSRKLAMPISCDTLLRMIRATGFEPPDAPRVVGIDDWAWRKGQRYGTIICDLERNRVLDLLPDRNANTVPSWLKRHPGIEVIARDRAGVYAEGARRGAPDATQVADRWHLLQNLGEALRLALSRHRKAVSAVGKAMMAEMSGDDDANPEPSVETSPKLDGLRRSRRNQRSELYAEVLDLRTTGMSVRTVERWLATGGERGGRTHARFSWILSISISKDAGRKANATRCTCGAKSSAVALQAAGRPSTGGPPPASSAHRPRCKMRDGGRRRAETMHGC